MISPSSPSVQVTSVTCAPSAAYLAMVAPVPIDSSSGWACTSRSRLASDLVTSSRLPRARPAETGRIGPVTTSFPRQNARTRNFTLGAPRSFQISPGGGTIAFLRSHGGADPVTCLWAMDVATGQERLIADPAELAAPGAAEDPVEKARRERVREKATGIVAAADEAFTMAAFALAGVVYLADLRAGTVRQLATLTPAADPRPDPAGTQVAYVSRGALRVISLESGQDRVLAEPEGADVT